MHSPTIDLQLAHRSVRRFTDGPVTDDQLAAIVAAAQSAPTSSNVQAWSVVVVRDAARRDRLAGYAGDQEFIRAAPILLVWLADLGRVRRLATAQGASAAATDYLESTVLGFIDAALAAQNAVVAAESLGLGTVFVGAIRNHPAEVAAELALPAGTFAVFGLALGVPDPSERAGVKPRLPQSVVVHPEQYDAARDVGIDRYDERLRAYNAEYGRSSGWIETVTARLRDTAALKGRDVLRARLADQGLPSH